MARKRLLLFTIYLVTFCLLSFAQSNNKRENHDNHETRSLESERLRALFIGNSYTYFNNLPQMVASLAGSPRSSEGRYHERLETEMLTVGGATLKRHWEDGKAAEAIRKAKWDYVILQEQSTLGPTLAINGIPQISDPKVFYEYARLFDAEVKKAGAKTIFYLTWARQNAPETQVALTSAYQSIAGELGAILAPAGIAWENALKQNPQPVLHLADKSHPTPLGSYLAACVIYATLFRKSPEGLPGRLLGHPVDSTGKVKDDASVELVNLKSTDAVLMQRIAWETVKSFRK